MDYKKANETSPLSDKLNLIPTFGWPASDVLLCICTRYQCSVVPIGRLGAINGTEVDNYLLKMKQYEQAQQIARSNN